MYNRISSDGICLSHSLSVTRPPAHARRLTPVRLTFVSQKPVMTGSGSRLSGSNSKAIKISSWPGKRSATRPPNSSRVHATEWRSAWRCREPYRRADARRLGHRVKPGDDNYFVLWNLNRTAVRRLQQIQPTRVRRRSNSPEGSRASASSRRGLAPAPHLVTAHTPQYFRNRSITHARRRGSTACCTSVTKWRLASPILDARASRGPSSKR